MCLVNSDKDPMKAIRNNSYAQHDSGIKEKSHQYRLNYQSAHRSHKSIVQEPVYRMAKEWIANDNKDHKQTIRVLRHYHTTSTPHLTKQCKLRQLQWFYSQQPPRYRRRSIRSKSRQRNLRRSTNIISNTTITSFNS